MFCIQTNNSAEILYNPAILSANPAELDRKPADFNKNPAVLWVNSATFQKYPKKTNKIHATKKERILKRGFVLFTY
jgi:hypothetical protein